MQPIIRYVVRNTRGGVLKQFFKRSVLFVFTMVCWVSLNAEELSVEELSFNEYLTKVAEDAKARGISEETINLAFDGLEPDPRVIGFDRKQPEFVQTFEQYLTARVTEFRVREGQRLFAEHRELLEAVEAKYDVDAEYIVAFWGLETSYGRYQGKYAIIRSLATLGNDPRRSRFFTSELLHALQVLDEGHVPLDKFVGAWAGAMGQGQFLPSSFLNFAEDFDGDGRKDVWSNEADVFASIANYLSKNGWRENAGWGARVTVPEDLDLAALKPESHDTRCRALRHHTRKMSIGEWRELGVNISDEPGDQAYALVIPDEGEFTTYLAGGNYRTILSYNCANKYAVSVGLLADQVNPGSS